MWCIYYVLINTAILHEVRSMNGFFMLFHTRCTKRLWPGGGPFYVRYALPVFDWFPKNLFKVIQCCCKCEVSSLLYYKQAHDSVVRWLIPYVEVGVVTTTSCAVEEVVSIAQLVMIVLWGEYKLTPFQYTSISFIVKL